MEVRCCSGSSHHARPFVWAKRGSNGVRRREYPMYVHAFPPQRVCSLNFFPPQASPRDDSHHPPLLTTLGKAPTKNSHLPPNSTLTLTTTSQHPNPPHLPQTKTVHCTTPYKPSLPLVQYALMIDAWSMGSRVHIYEFNGCGPSATYKYEVFKQLQPVLSYYTSNPHQAAESLDELMDEAVKVVPKELWKCTSVAVKATAGLRLLGEKPSRPSYDSLEDIIKDALESSGKDYRTHKRKVGVFHAIHLCSAAHV